MQVHDFPFSAWQASAIFWDASGTQIKLLKYGHFPILVTRFQYLSREFDDLVLEKLLIMLQLTAG